MKHVKILVAFFFFFASAEAFAQYYDPYAPYNPGGVDRTIDRQKNAPKSKKKNAKKETKDIVDLTVEQLDKKLNLDDFQEAAIKVIYNDHKDEIMALPNEDLSYDAKKEKGEILAQKIDKKILALLSKDQAKVYNEIVASRN